MRNNIETVFDHNITAKEWDNICSIDRKLYLNIVDEQTSKLHLAALFYNRGDKEKAEKYLDGLPPLVVNDFWRGITHP